MTRKGICDIIDRDQAKGAGRRTELKMKRYETHLHTLPVSKCAKFTVRETLEFYKSLGYEGVFITNHFIDGNIGIDKARPFEEKIDFYFSDYEEGVRIGKEIGISVFLGIEMSYKGTDFLVYGMDKEYCLAHPEMEQMKKSALLPMLMNEGFLVIQAHPFRQASYIDHIRLFPAGVHGIEVYNACRTELENEMAEKYAEHYGFIRFAGSDNHVAHLQKRFGGMQSETPIIDERDLVRRVKDGSMTPFSFEIE